MPLVGSNTHALMAVSTKYLSSRQGGWEPSPGACGKCMCVRMHGCDEAYNPYPDRGNVLRHVGLTFAAVVGDRCARRRCGRLHFGRFGWRLCPLQLALSSCKHTLCCDKIVNQTIPRDG